MGAFSAKSAWDANRPKRVKMKRKIILKIQIRIIPNVGQSQNIIILSVASAAAKATAPKTHPGGTHKAEKNGTIK